MRATKTAKYETGVIIAKTVWGDWKLNKKLLKVHSALRALLGQDLVLVTSRRP
jgi:hypothetical protein